MDLYVCVCVCVCVSVSVGVSERRSSVWVVSCDQVLGIMRNADLPSCTRQTVTPFNVQLTNPQEREHHLV